MNNVNVKTLQLYMAIMDFFVINAVFFLTVFIFKRVDLIENTVEYTTFGFLLSIAWLLVILVFNIYNIKYVLSFELFTKVTIQAYWYFLLVIIVYLFFFRMIALSRIFLTTVLSVIPFALLLNRVIYLGLSQYLRKLHFFTTKVVVIGYNNLSKRLVNYLEEEGNNKKVIGYCEEFENVTELSHYPILSNINETIDICKKHGVTEIYSTIAPEHNNTIYQLIQTADENCIRFKLVPDLGFFIKKPMYIDFYKEIPVMVLRREPLEDFSNRIKKRIFDILVSSFVILFILSWLIPLLAILIMLESRGPIFFAQERTGKDNKKFICLKFRSMRVNDNANLVQATKNDSRITKLGALLRKTSLDEFPQFFNVLRGHMSIAGPRPHMIKHTDEYSKRIGKYMVRQLLKPGITGWAQVNGLRGETHTLEAMQKRVDYDLYYLENWSLLFDVKILFMTIFKTLGGDERAY